MFTPDGLATFLFHPANDGHTVAVSIGRRMVYVGPADLTCASCGGPIDVTRRSPAKYLAINRILTGGVCGDCRPA